MKKQLPTVALIGRINAGKSTLFNTLSDTTKAITSNIPGTTRDLNYSQISWRRHSFTLIDTGGLDAARLGDIEKYVQEKAYQTIASASLLLLLIDGRQELTAEDRKIAKFIKQENKKCLLVINKIDGPSLRRRVSPDFYKLGLGEPHIISSLNGTGTGDLLDAVTEQLPVKAAQEIHSDLRLSIVGKTNVGKSSIINVLLGEDRIIVTPMPHTTREPQDIYIKYKGKDITLVDTAGLRKKRKISHPLEKISAQKTLKMILNSDIAILVTDVSQSLSFQDHAIAKQIQEKQRGIIIVANKWDLIKEKDTETIKKYTKNYRRFFTDLAWAPIIFTSALTKQRLLKLIDTALTVQKNMNKVVPDDALYKILSELKPKKAKPSMGKKNARIFKLKQSGINPPRFILYVNKPDRIHKSFLNLMEKKIRTQYNLIGTPVKIICEQN